MTDQYRISIDDKTGATVRGRVHIINPDSESVPPGRDFPMRMILEVWHRLREGFFFTSGDDRMPDDRVPGDFGQAQAVAANLEVTAEFERLWDLDNGAHIHLSDQEVEELRAVDEIRDDERKQAATQALKERYGVKSLSVGLSAGVSYVRRPRDGAAFHEVACEIITDYQVGATHNWPPPWDGVEDDEDFDEDEYADKLERMRLEDYPYAEFTFTVKDPRYIEHLSGGIHFSTTIYGEFGW